MKKYLEKFVLWLHSRYGITPNILTFTRIFAAPWLALLVSEIIAHKSPYYLWFTLVVYVLIVITDVLDGILARALIEKNTQNGVQKNDAGFGGMIDRLADKILIISVLIPFGLNLFTFFIILGETLLAYDVLTSPPHKKSAGTAGKLKMIFQAFLIPILVISKATSFISEVVLASYILITIVLTYVSVYSHYFQDDK